MSLRSFFLWFWGIVFGSGIAAAGTLAVLHAPVAPPSASPGSPQTADLQQPLPIPPVPAAADTSVLRQTPSPRLHIVASRSVAPRRVAELPPETRITVVPPIPPERVPTTTSHESAAPESRAAARTERPEPRLTSGPKRTVPSTEWRARAYAAARSYSRYGYYTYSYPYAYQSYPYQYYYSYNY